jgi:alpha-tubulin suppressor-like RCC1 family protein
MFVTEFGKVYACGGGSLGQLGLERGVYSNYDSPELLASLDRVCIKQVACGANHSLLLTSSGEVLACGSNALYQLGLPLQQIYSSPTKIDALNNILISKISANSHSAAVTASGELYLWGTAIFGTY